MEAIYLKAEEEVRRRRRRLNVLRGVRVGLTISLGLTALSGVLWALGLWGPKPPLGLLLLGNALGAGLGALWGVRLPLPLPEDLYRVDRALGLEERLVTIYELRRRGAEGLLRALYRQLDDLRGRLRPENVRRALSLPPTERRAWIGTAALGLLSLGFLIAWMAGFGPLSWEGLLAGRVPGLLAPPSLPDAAVPPVDEDRREAEDEDEEGEGISAARRPAEALPYEERRALCRRDRASQTSLTEEQWSELCEGSNGSPPPAAEARTVGQALERLLERLVSGEISAEEARSELQALLEETPPGALREALERAAQAADEQELRERIQEALSQLAPNPPPGADSESPPESGDPSPQGEAGSPTQPASTPGSNASGETQKGSGNPDPASSPNADADAAGTEEAEESQASAPNADADADESSEGSQEGGAEGAGGESSQAQGQSGANPDSDSGSGTGEMEAGEEKGKGNEKGKGEGAGADSELESGSESSEQRAKSGQEGAETARSGSEGEGEGSESSEPESDSEARGDRDGDRSGSGIGTEEGADAAESPPPLWTNLDDGLLIQSGALPRDVQLLSRLLAQGLPVDLAGRGEDGAPRVVLNLARFESLLETRDLPPELRALVRAYFLAIAEGPSSSPSPSPSQNATQEKGEKP